MGDFEPIEYVKDGADKGRVVRVDQAQELATVEAKRGHDVRIATEKEMNTGLTEAQMENLKLIEQLPGKYSNAFVPDKDGTPIRTSADGRPYLVTEPVGRDFMVVTREGVGFFDYFSKQSPLTPLDNTKNLVAQFVEKADLGHVLDDVRFGVRPQHNYPFYELNVGSDSYKFRLKEANDPRTAKDRARAFLQNAEEVGVERKKTRVDPKADLVDLF